MAPQIEPYVVVLCTGRCGSLFLHKVVTKAGFDFPHEVLGKHGGIGWNLLNTIHTIKVNNKIEDRDAFYVHLIREPLSGIASILSFTDYHWNRLENLRFNFTYDKPLVRAMEYWLHWNQLCDHQASMTVHLSSITDGTLDFLFGKNLPWSEIPKNTNSRKHPVLSLSDLDKADASLARQIGTWYANLTRRQR